MGGVMAAGRAGAVKSLTRLTVRCPRSAQRGKIRVRGGKLLEFGIERDRSIHIRARGGQITALARIATEIELNGGLGRVFRFCVTQDFFRGFARAKKEGRWHYINTAAKIVWQESKD